MPEATVDEDRDGVPGQHEVRRVAGTDLAVQPEAEPEGVDCAPESLLRFGVPDAAAAELCAPRRAHPSFACAHFLAEAGISPGTKLLVFSDGDGRIVLRRAEDAINDLLREGTL